jgi:hypothetical protein
MIISAIDKNRLDAIQAILQAVAYGVEAGIGDSIWPEHFSRLEHPFNKAIPYKLGVDNITYTPTNAERRAHFIMTLDDGTRLGFFMKVENSSIHWRQD